MGSWKVRLIVHPVTIAALAVLVINDHLLKQRWPGVITGKLSDLAGVWLIGALISALVGNVRLGATVTALAFIALKTVPVAALWAAPVLGGVTQTDRSDLVALIVLWPLVRLGRSLYDYSPAVAPERLASVGAVLVCICSVFATSATSCDTKNDVEEVRLDADGRVLVEYGHEWYYMDGDDPQRTLAVPVGEVTKRKCGGEGCYSVRRTGVYLDGELVFSYNAEQVRQIDGRSGCIQTEMFSSLVVRELPEGDDVWVAMGMAGVLHRSPDGTWHELRIFDSRPPDPVSDQVEVDGAGVTVDEPQRRPELWMLPLMLGFGACIVLFVSFVGRRRNLDLWIATVSAVVTNAGAVAILSRRVAPEDFLPNVPVVAMLVFVTAVMVVAQFPWLILQRRPAHVRQPKSQAPDPVLRWAQPPSHHIPPPPDPSN